MCTRPNLQKLSYLLKTIPVCYYIQVHSDTEWLYQLSMDQIDRFKIIRI